MFFPHAAFDSSSFSSTKCVLIHIVSLFLCAPLNHILTRYCAQKAVLEFAKL